MELSRQVLLSDAQLAEIRRLNFQLNRLVDEGMAGQYRSAFRGRGIEFEEVREYSPGDDVRSIDWKVTARCRKPYVKVYREERELIVMIVVDLSASTQTGTRGALRSSLIAKIGAALTLIASKNNDKVGLITFSNKLESYHPPRKARTAVWRILHEVFAGTAQLETCIKGAKRPLLALGTEGTDLEGVLCFLQQVLKRRSIVFLLSDFFAPLSDVTLGSLAKRHDVNAIIVRDPADYLLPDAGLISLSNPEDGTIVNVDSSDPFLQQQYAEITKAKRQELFSLLERNNAGIFEVGTDDDFFLALRRYFDKRSKRFFSSWNNLTSTDSKGKMSAYV